MSSSNFTNKDFIQSIMMPVVLVFLTALVGTPIGIWFQDRSWRRNQLFNAKLDQIKSAQEEARKILSEVDESRQLIEANEYFILTQIQEAQNDEEKRKIIEFYREPVTQVSMDRTLTTLRHSKTKLNALNTSTKTLLKDTSVSDTIDQYSSNLDKFLECATKNIDNGFTEDCSTKYPQYITSLENVVSAFSQMTDNFINEYQ